MWLSQPLPFIEEFIEALGRGLQAHDPKLKLSGIQRSWLGFCLMGREFDDLEDDGRQFR